MSPKRFITKVNFYLTNPDKDLLLLNDIEKKIIEMRLGLGNYNRCHSLQEITDTLSDEKHSHTWARDKITKILKKVRHATHDDKF